jgi:hypothetical protein
LAPRIFIAREPIPEGLETLKQKGIAYPESIDLVTMIFRNLGVPESAVIRSDQPLESTFEEAERVAALVKDKRYRSLILVKDAATWGQIVKRMVAYGTPLNVEQRAVVVRYLATRSVFAGKCGGCHDLTRVVGDTPGPRDWPGLTERMAEHVREFEKQGKLPAGVEFSPAELAEVAALLQVVIP